MWSKIKQLFERRARKKQKKEIYELELEFKKSLADLGKRHNFDPVKKQKQIERDLSRIVEEASKEIINVKKSKKKS